LNARNLILILGVLGGCGGLSVHRGPERADSGALDFTAVDAFWRVQALLRAGQEPSVEEWQQLLATPGYRLARRAYGDELQEDLRLAFQPSRRSAFDSVTHLGRDRGLRLMHLQEAASRRPRLEEFRDSIVHSAIRARALAIAARYLPPGATARDEPPVVVFAIFADDGYAFDSILVDLLHASQSDLTLFLAHEFHHMYADRLAPRHVDGNGRLPDRDLRTAFENLRKEGIADLIDKPYPVAFTNRALAAYAQKYNEEYARTPTTLAMLDSLLRGAADDSVAMTEAGKRVKSLLWSSGHANGAYMAREILETFGADSLFPAVRDPAAFIRTFNFAEAASGRAPVLSTKAMRVLEMLERRYWSGPPGR
jgi:hypothetical protein